LAGALPVNQLLPSLHAVEAALLFQGTNPISAWAWKQNSITNAAAGITLFQS
jgi:hypothetical protein